MLTYHSPQEIIAVIALVKQAEVRSVGLINFSGSSIAVTESELPRMAC